MFPRDGERMSLVPSQQEELELPPRAGALIESLRDMGYSLRTALADVIDNAITANAREVMILADTRVERPAIGILDDGAGMTRDELLEAMRPGTRNPLEPRHQTDLGRFGLGLKTASFSQCRRLTVLTRRKGRTSCARWDLDTVAETDRWLVEIPTGRSRRALVESLGWGRDPRGVGKARPTCGTLGQSGLGPTAGRGGRTLGLRVPSFPVRSSACCLVDEWSAIGTVRPVPLRSPRHPASPD